MRPALRPRRLRMCERCRWNRVQEQRRLWPLRFLHLGTEIRRPLVLKRHRRTTRRRVDSSRDSADFLPRCSANVPLTCPSVPRGQAKFFAAPASIPVFGVRVSTRILQTARKEEKMRIVWTLVWLLMMLGSAGWAQIPTKGNVFFGRNRWICTDTLGPKRTLRGVPGRRGAHQPKQRDLRLRHFVRQWCRRRIGLSPLGAGNASRTTRLDQHSLLWSGPERRAVLDRSGGAFLARQGQPRAAVST